MVLEHWLLHHIASSRAVTVLVRVRSCALWAKSVDKALQALQENHHCPASTADADKHNDQAEFYYSTAEYNL